MAYSPFLVLLGGEIPRRALKREYAVCRDKSSQSVRNRVTLFTELCELHRDPQKDLYFSLIEFSEFCRPCKQDKIFFTEPCEPERAIA
jgi:hypothetical protein